jgi:hypothetical protein
VPNASLARRKKITFVLLTLGLVVVIPMACVELVLRFVWGAPYLPAAEGLVRSDPTTFTTHVANYRGVLNTPYYRIAYATNSQGLRDFERPLRKPPRTFRILALGDSYVEGQGVKFQELFLTQAEAALNASGRFPYKVEIIKAGVGGWGPANELAYLNQYGWAFEPDAVLVCFFTGNDYEDAAVPDQFAAYRGLRIEKSKLAHKSVLLDLKIALRKHIYLYGLLVEGWNGLRHRDTRDLEDTVTLEKCRPAAEFATPPVREAVAGFQAACRNRHVPLYWAVLPHRAQLEPTRITDVARRHGIDATQLKLDRPSMVISDLARQAGAAVFDATPHLRSFAEQGHLIGLQGDSHYNAATHRVLAEALATYLETQVLPDTSATTRTTP